MPAFILRAITVVLFCSAATSSLLYGQQNQQQTLYAIVDHARVTDESTDEEHLKLEQAWEKVHQKRVDAGLLNAWYFNKVTGNERAGYCTIRVFDSLDKRGKSLPQGTWDGVFNDAELALFGRTDKIRHLVRSEVWRLNASALSPDGLATPGYIDVHFIKATPGRVDEYRQMEQELFTKLHQARIDAGDLTSWWFFSREFPSGYDLEWDFVTVNHYPSKEAAERPFDWDGASKALTDSERESFPEVGKLRKIVRREFWEPVAKTE